MGQRVDLSELGRCELASDSSGVGYLLCQGIRGRAIFLGILFVQKFQSKISILKKNSEYSHNLLGNRPNFFVEHVTKSQNQLKKAL